MTLIVLHLSFSLSILLFIYTNYFNCNLWIKHINFDSNFINQFMKTEKIPIPLGSSPFKVSLHGKNTSFQSLQRVESQCRGPIQ